MKSPLRIIFRWSWLVTVPIVAITATWAFTSLTRYQTFGVQFNHRPFTISLAKVAEEEAHNLFRRFLVAVDPRVQGWRAGGAELPVISLFARQTALGELNSDLPYSGFTYVKGQLRNEKKLRKVRLRYRGDFLWHWWSAKKSYRVKTKKKQLFHGMRAFNLIVPKFEGQINNHLGYELASLMGLIAPRSEMVNLTMNGAWKGVYLLVEQLDESTLRRHGLMPGDIYRGELIGRDRYAGVSNHVFEHPGLWDKVAVNNHYPPDSMAPLQKLLVLIRAGSSPVTQKKASQILDMEAWGTFSAFETLIQSIHYGVSHNWRIYYDPAREKLMPMVWDPDAWHPNWMPKKGTDPQFDFLPSELHRFLHANGDFLRAKHRAMRRFFTDGLESKFLQHARQLEKRMKTAIRADQFVQSQVSRSPLGTAERIAGMQKLLTDIEHTFSAIRNEYVTRPPLVSYDIMPKTGVYQFRVEGRGIVERIEIRFAGEPVALDATPELRFWDSGQTKTVQLRSSANAMERTLTLWPDLIAHHELTTMGIHGTKKYRIDFTPGYFELSTGSTSPVAEVLVHTGSGTYQSARKVEDISPASFQNIYQPARHTVSLKPLRWTGTMNFRGLREIENDVTIEAGTTLLFEPGATLILRGKLLANGTPTQPIRFLPMKPEQGPWGSVVLHGPLSSGSRLRHCVFDGGSGYKTAYREYSGMLSIHAVSDVRIDGCTFGRNFVVDDTVHAVYSDVRIHRSTFEKAQSDAVDLDISTALISDSVFRDNGNDGVDLMTTQAFISGSTFTNNLDKGVSAGEGSELLLVDSQFRNNAIGTQFKDGTSALLGNISFVGNVISADAYKKNWRYGAGGTASIAFSEVSGSATTISADSDSLITLVDTALRTSVETIGNVVVQHSQLGSDDEAGVLIEQEPFAGFREEHRKRWIQGSAKAP